MLCCGFFNSGFITRLHLTCQQPWKMGQTALNFIKRGIKVDSAARKSEAQAMIDQDLEVCNLIF
jgi:hypothetical protein